MKKKTTPKRKKSSIGTTGRRIMTQAKKIQKKNPKMKWQDCVSKAAKKI